MVSCFTPNISYFPDLEARVTELVREFPWFWSTIPTRVSGDRPECLPMPIPFHPLQSGTTFFSPGGHFLYRVVGPCCRLFDREQLPWPCCRIEWRTKEPSWRRVGKRLVPDIATKTHPSYCVEILGAGYTSQPLILTLYAVKLTPELQNWWHSRQLMGDRPDEKTNPHEDWGQAPIIPNLSVV
jgi:hypothetical protein